LQPALFCMQFADSAGNIAAGALIQTNTLYNCISEFSSVLTDILRSRGLFHETGSRKHLCYIIWKGYLSPFVPALKGVKFLFAACRKGFNYHMQYSLIFVDFLDFACGSWIPSCSLQKGRWFLLELLQKVFKYPLEQIACGICELHATPIMLAIYRWENLIKKLKSGDNF
jgi:hypothetical protein